LNYPYDLDRNVTNFRRFASLIKISRY